MMSIDQLSLSIDSMKSEKMRKRSVFATQIVSYWHFYTHIDSTMMANHELDESFVLKNESFLDNFEPADKKFITESALSAARNMYEITGYQVFEMDALNKHFMRFNVEFHRKFTLSVACFILFFIGAPLGAIIRKGGIGLPLVLATLIFVVYYILSITGEKFVREGMWNPVFGMWLSSMVLFPFGLWLTLKTINDSPLMDAEAWYKVSTKITMPLKKLYKRMKR
jgi:lipopolysaccharide export system permease protein